MLRLNMPIIAPILSAPIACKEGVKDTWRAVAASSRRSASPLLRLPMFG